MIVVEPSEPIDAPLVPTVNVKVPSLMLPVMSLLELTVILIAVTAEALILLPNDAAELMIESAPSPPEIVTVEPLLET